MVTYHKNPLPLRKAIRTAFLQPILESNLTKILMLKADNHELRRNVVSKLKILLGERKDLSVEYYRFESDGWLEFGMVRNFLFKFEN